MIELLQLGDRDGKSRIISVDGILMSL